MSQSPSHGNAVIDPDKVTFRLTPYQIVRIVCATVAITIFVGHLEWSVISLNRSMARVEKRLGIQDNDPPPLMAFPPVSAQPAPQPIEAQPTALASHGSEVAR